MDKERLSGYLFPFSAIMGRDDAKLAIEVALVSKDIRTVLIQGVSGSAKTVLVRSIPCISSTQIVNLPPSAQTGQIFGQMDIEDTLKTGTPSISDGILMRADGRIIIADDVNLMDRTVLRELLEAVRTGNAFVEREGISCEYSFDTKLFATMNSSESKIDDHTLDLFDLCVNFGNIDNEEIRYEVTRRLAMFEKDPKKFVKVYGYVDCQIYDRIAKAKERLPFVSVSDEVYGVIGTLCSKLEVEGHRGDIALTLASKAIAALNERDEVTIDDVKEASKISLSHRITQMPDDEENTSKEEGSEKQNTAPDMSPSDDPEGRPQNDAEDNNDRGTMNDEEESVYAVGESFHVIDFVSLDTAFRIRSSKGGGKHEKSLSSGSSGRYIRTRIPNGQITDLAFDATLRAAAPYQKLRPKGDVAINLVKDDLRQKVREKKTGISILFLVDASGSMGARKRMVAVKGAILSLLQDSYKNRDKVALMSFRKDSAEMLLTFTKSVDFAYRKLKDMPTGGSTPLALAIMKADKEVSKEKRSNPTEKCYVVLITDGRANVPMDSGDALSDAMKTASFVGEYGQATWITVDSSTGYPHLDNVVKMCERMKGIYLRLEQLNANALADRVRKITRC